MRKLKKVLANVLRYDLVKYVAAFGRVLFKGFSFRQKKKAKASILLKMA